MYKIAIIGDRESVLGFKALGLEVHPAEDYTQAKTILHTLAKDDYAIIYITEQLAVQMEGEIVHYKDDVTPAIILFPGKGGNLGLGMAAVHKSVERAVGANILGED